VRSLPQIPEFANSTIAGKLPQPKTHQVATSEKLTPEADVFDNYPKDVATSLDIQLPMGAVNTTPSGLIGTLIKQALPAATTPPATPAGATTEPVVVQIPIEKKAGALPAPKQPELAPPSKPTAKKASQQKPATATATDDDPFAVKNLFEPAVTPVKTEAPTATDVDPFAP
jgi:hypothetical protein